MSATTIAVKATRNTTSRNVNRTLVRLPSEDRTVIIQDVAVSVDDRPALDKAIAENNSRPWRTFNLEVVEVTVGEAPEPPTPLPTEAGFYSTSQHAEGAHSYGAYHLNRAGEWRYVWADGEVGPLLDPAREFGTSHGLKRLVTVD